LIFMFFLFLASHFGQTYAPIRLKQYSIFIFPWIHRMASK